jgi:hypothetical protein
MTEFIINWGNVFSQKEFFMNSKPFKFSFIENIFDENFYKKLYQMYPKVDNTWFESVNLNKSQLVKYWKNSDENETVPDGPDPIFSKEWNEFKLYAETEEFISNFRKFSGTKVNKLKNFSFMTYKKGGFQIPHIHNVGPNTLVLMFYFSKGWQEGDAGGTYMASDIEESKIIFEPYNLDNSLALFQDSSKAAHGVRIITKDVVRKAVYICLEEYSDKNGWTGIDTNSEEFKSNLIEI